MTLTICKIEWLTFSKGIWSERHTGIEKGRDGEKSTFQHCCHKLPMKIGYAEHGHSEMSKKISETERYSSDNWNAKKSDNTTIDCLALWRDAHFSMYSCLPIINGAPNTGNRRSTCLRTVAVYSLLFHVWFYFHAIRLTFLFLSLSRSRSQLTPLCHSCNSNTTIFLLALLARTFGLPAGRCLI